jgi:quinol monooxygenase YgiN
MTKNVVRLAVDFTINDGKTAEFQAIARKMIAGSQQEPGTLAYDFYLSRDGKRCRLVEAYVDADALVLTSTAPW